jgi:hypothetical protein
MLDLALKGMSLVSEQRHAAIPARAVLNRPPGNPKLVLRSRIPGRDRWYVDVLEDNPLLAAAVELVLRSEEGIEEARVNPLTGRVLVRYWLESVSESIEFVIRRAVQAGPMSREEFAALPPERHQGSLSQQLLTAEIACSLSHLVLFGGFCPLGLAATGVLLLLHRHGTTHTHA